MLALLGLTSLGILTVANALVLNVVAGAFNLPWLALILLLEIILIVGAFALRPSLRPTVRWNGQEILGMFLVGATFLAHAIYLAPDDLMPVSFSVDNSHQHLLVNFIYQNNRFPHDVAYLYIYNDYPVAPSALAAFSAHLLGVLPAQTMYLLAALFVTVQVMLVYGVGIELLPRRPASCVLAMLAALSIFFVYRYSIHAFAERFYSNMIMGDLIVLLTLWVVVVRDRLSPLFFSGVGIVLVFGCLHSYPAWTPFVSAPLLASVLLDQRMAMRRRLALAGLVTVIMGVMTITAVVYQWDFITWFTPVRDRRLQPSWESLGGLFLLLAAWGFVVLARDWRRYTGFVLFLTIDLLLVTALYTVALLDKLALYIPDKTFYFNIFVLAALTAWGLNWGWERLARARLGKAWLATLLMLLISLSAIMLVNKRFPPPTLYPITLDEYRVAYRVSLETPDIELAYLVRHETVFYWIYGCVLNHTPTLQAQTEQWRAEKPTYEKWIHDAAAPRRALVSDLTSLPQDGLWRVLTRVGDSGVIEKTRWNE